MPQPNNRVDASTNDIIDAIPADFPGDTAGVQKVVNIHITLCEQRQTLHYNPCLKYLLAPTCPTTSRLEAAVEKYGRIQARMVPSGNKSIKTAATINPIARTGTPDFANKNGIYVAAIAGGPANLPALR